MLAFASALRAPVASIPLERDEGGYAYIAQRWLLGEVPYSQSFDQKLPGTYFSFLLVQRFLGSSAASIHWGGQIQASVALVLLFFLGRKIASPAVGMLAALIAALLFVEPSLLGNAVNSEMIMLPPLVGAALASVTGVERRSRAWIFTAGLLGGAAILVKQVALPHVAFLFLYVAWSTRRTPSFASLMVAGGLAPALPVLAYFVLQGAWGAFHDAVIAHNAAYAGWMPLSLYPLYFKASAVPIAGALWPVLLLMLPGLAGPSRDARPTAGWESFPSSAFVNGWLVCSCLGTMATGYFRSHYFTQMIPPVALLAALGASRIGGWLPWGRARTVAPALLVTMALGFGVWHSRWYYRPGSPDAKSRRIYGLNPFPESVPVARFIADHSEPHEKVFIYGSEPQILYLARRASASRYIYVYPLTTTLEDAERRQPPALEEVKRNKPRFVVTVFVPTSTSMRTRTNPYFSDGLRDYLYRYYEVAGVVAYLKGRPPTLITGEDARRLWEQEPLWYDEPAWCSMVIWRKTHRLVEAQPPPIRRSERGERDGSPSIDG